MKRLSLLTFLLMSAFSCLVGCEDADMVRANPISMKIDGEFFMNYPDTTRFTLFEPLPDREFFLSDEGFTLEIRERLYSVEEQMVYMSLVFEGDGDPELGRRYSLVVPEEGAVSDRTPVIESGETRCEAADGWLEFSEFGVDEENGRAYMSGTFGLTMKGGTMNVTDGKFGRMLECAYYNYKTDRQ